MKANVDSPSTDFCQGLWVLRCIEAGVDARIDRPDLQADLHPPHRSEQLKKIW
jgi:hypothetical protein